MARAAATTAEGCLPIVIGVCGHRHLRPTDLPHYRACVAEFFDDLARRYPATPLRVLSALAAGADRLVAEVALERGHELIVPLPLEPADYERDFPDSVGEFRALLARVPPERVFVWQQAQAGDEAGAFGAAIGGPARAVAGAHAGLAAGAPPCVPPAERDRRYAEVGAFVAGQSHILLAIWDGAPAAQSSAGTAAVVALKLGHTAVLQVSAEAALNPDDSGPVFHVRAVRRGSDAPPPRQVQWLFPPDHDAALLHAVCSRLDRFNTEAAHPPIRAAAPAAAAALLPGVQDAGRGDAALAMAFACADRLAARYQRITHRVLRLTLVLAAVMALTFEVYAEVLPARAVPLVYLACFALLALVLVWHRRLDAQARYLDYRALAEGLRVQFYWRLAGLTDRASASYLRKQLDELRWIREALRGSGAAPPPATAHPGLALGCWVRGQADYYGAHACLHEHRMRRIERCSGVFLGIGLLAALCLVVLWEPLERRAAWHHWAVLVMGFAPVAAALWEAYGERIGARTQANQFARFAAIFRRAERFAARLEAGEQDRPRREGELALLRELGHEALIENADWVLLQRDRPIALPKG